MVTKVRAPGSSANLGPGFDVLGIALSRYVWVSDQPGGDACGSSHIARIAYEQAGGSGDIWFGFELEPGRGLGFSAAARAAGAMMACIQSGMDATQAQQRSYQVVAELEGHGDNAAPAVFGGMHVIAGDCNHRINASFPGQFLCWVPELVVPTDESRLQLPAMVSRPDAIYNLGRVGLLMSAVYERDLSLLRTATEDRLHQPQRLDAMPEVKEAIDVALEAGAAAAWLSGSGPTVAIIVDDESSEKVEAALPPQGKVLALDVDTTGAVEF